MKFHDLRPLRAFWAILGSVALAACGGGGGGGSDSTASASGCYYTYSSATPSPPASGQRDPLLSEQWYLTNLGVAPVWSGGNRAEDIRVAVIDDAIEVVHEDLVENARRGAWWDYRKGALPGAAPLPCWLDDDHGTRVAGVILARDDNGVGIAGVASRASLGAYNALATKTNADIASALGQDSEITDIYNNSWGSVDNGRLSRPDNLFTGTIEDGIRKGRNGLGSIYVFPAGNGGPLDNSNFDGFVNQRGVIAVCALDNEDQAPIYGEPGANILVCAPGGSGPPGQPNVFSTAPNNSYDANFAGTSASTPMVSGVVALMLEANRKLTWRDVRLILARSARKNDPGDTGWTTNFGLSFNHKYGFGAVDAKAAVDMASTWSSVGNSNSNYGSCSASKAFPTPKTIRDVVVTDSLNINGVVCPKGLIGHIEFIEVEFSAEHTYSGDIKVELISPNGRISELATSRQCLDDSGNEISCGSYTPSPWRFGTVRHLDEPAAGWWTLRVTDDVPVMDAGRWLSWKITLWGSIQ